MPITFGMKGSSYLCSQTTGGVENAVPLHLNIFRNCFVKNTQQSFLHLQHTRHQLLLNGFSNCVAILALDFDTPVSWARRFSDFLGVCSSLAPVPSNFSVSTRRLRVPFFPKFIHRIMNCLFAGYSFITKFSPTLSSRSVFHLSVVQKYTLL
jgi:hypothetical protein